MQNLEKSDVQSCAKKLFTKYHFSDFFKISAPRIWKYCKVFRKPQPLKPIFDLFKKSAAFFSGFSKTGKKPQPLKSIFKKAKSWRDFAKCCKSLKKPQPLKPILTTAKKQRDLAIGHYWPFFKMDIFGIFLKNFRAHWTGSRLEIFEKKFLKILEILLKFPANAGILIFWNFQKFFNFWKFQSLLKFSEVKILKIFHKWKFLKFSLLKISECSGISRSTEIFLKKKFRKFSGILEIPERSVFGGRRLADGRFWAKMVKNGSFWPFLTTTIFGHFSRPPCGVAFWSFWRPRKCQNDHFWRPSAWSHA